MTTQIALILLSFYAALTALIVEGVKKLFSDKVNFSYNLLAIIIALVVGAVGTAIYYQFNEIYYTINNTIYLVLISLASGLVAMVGFDKVKQLIAQITG